MYLIFGIILDMFQVYYCIRKLNRKATIGLKQILLWPGYAVFSIIKLLSRLSNKYTDLMIDAYGDKKLIEDNSKKKNDKWTITTTDDYEPTNSKQLKAMKSVKPTKIQTNAVNRININEYIIFRMTANIDCHKTDAYSIIELSELFNNSDKYNIMICDYYTHWIDVEDIGLVNYTSDYRNLSIQIIFDLIIKKNRVFELSGDTFIIMIEPKDKISHHGVNYSFKCNFISGKNVVYDCVQMHSPIILEE